MNTPLVDCHTHTSFSDGASTFEESVRAAAAAGLSVLACTDHLTLPASMERVADAQCPSAGCASAAPPSRPPASSPPRWRPASRSSMASSATGTRAASPTWPAGRRTYPLPWAASTGWETQATWRPAPRASPAPRAWSLPGGLGSGAGWIDFSDDLHIWRLGPDEVCRRYVDAWCAACESPLGFSSMAHPDCGALPTTVSRPRSTWYPSGSAWPRAPTTRTATSRCRVRACASRPAPSTPARACCAPSPAPRCPSPWEAMPIAAGRGPRHRGHLPLRRRGRLREHRRPRADGSWVTLPLR